LEVVHEATLLDMCSSAGAHGLLQGPGGAPKQALVRHRRNRQRAAPLGRSL